MSLVRLKIVRKAGTVAACVLVLGVMAAPQSAFAEDDDGAGKSDAPRNYPYLKGEITTEFHYDNISGADDAATGGSDAYNKTEAEIGAYFNRFFSIQTTLKYEPVRDRNPGEDRFFEDHGLYAEQLYAQLNLAPFTIIAGKYDPAFGKAWDITPGLYGTDMNEDYQITERVGGAVSVEREHTAIGTVKVTAGVFYADTSVLSDSAFTSRGRTHHLDGGLSNTGTPDSLALAMEGSELPGLPGVSYNLGYVHQAAGVDDIDDQNGFVFGVNGERKYNSVKFEWIAETAYFDYGGNLFESAGNETELYVKNLWYLTLGGKVTVDKYNLAVAYTGRQADLYNGTNYDDYQFQVSAGMELPREWTIDVGYKLTRDEGEDGHTVGVMLKKKFEFDTGKLEKASPK
jgi:hypothetical protein